MYPSELKYSKEHEWLRVNGDIGHVGITDYAQNQLGDVVYVELPEVGQRFNKGEQFGSIESVKAVSDLYCPVSGEVIEVNSGLDSLPEAVNKKPHESWIIVLRMSDLGELSELLGCDDYTKLLG